MSTKKEQGENFLNKILMDKKIQQEWQKKYKTEQTDVLSSDEEEDINLEVMAVRNKINRIAQTKHKKSLPKAQPTRSNQAEIKNRISELSEFKSYTSLLIEENLMYAKQALDISAALKEMYLFAKTNFNSVFKDKWFQSIQKDKQDPLVFIKELTKVLYILSDSQFKYSKIEEDLEKANTEKENLSRINQRLMSHIEERKTYSESLKQKIAKLKQQIAALESSGSKSNKSTKIEQINTEAIEQKLDIKYMNRSDLILILKSLMQKIKKHSRQCKNQVNRIGLEELQKFFPRDLATAIKRSSSRNGSREGSRNSSKQKNNH